jgi:diguanylate cyclase (GGDEF)-like protein
MIERHHKKLADNHRKAMAMDGKCVLLVEDNPGDARLMVELLNEAEAGEIELHQVVRISAALKLLSERKFDLVLLDLSLPDGNGLDTVLRMCAAIPHMPVIVLTGLEDDAFALAAVQAGAQDYLVKGQVNGSGIARAIRYAIERKRLEERLLFMATHDALTGLPNRRLFQDRMTQAIERARRNAKGKQEKWEMAVILLDGDDFKSVNDTLGHAQGDLLLQAVADRLQSSIRRSDSLARMGGDEFTLIFENMTGREDAEVLAKKIQAVFSQPFQLGDRPIRFTASIGVSLYPCDGEDAESLLKHADIAMYYAKRDRNRVCFYRDCRDDL